MEFFYSSFLGGVHSISAFIALISGVIVFLNPKGTEKHKLVGYIYAVGMIVLNVTAIPLQNMFGGFGWFHLFLLLSLPYVVSGMYFPLFGRKHKNWTLWHFKFMSYSFIGLLAAFVAEVIIRVPLAMGVSNLNQYVAAIFLFAGLVGGVGHRVVYVYQAKNFSE